MNFRLTGIIFGLVLLLVGGLLVSLLLDGGETASVPDGLLDPLTRAGVKATDVDRVELARTQPGEETLVFSKTGDRWELRQPTAAKVDGFAVDALVRDLFRAAPGRDPELTGNPAVHGLDKPTVRVTLGKGDATATVNVGLTTIGGDKAKTYVTTGAAPGRPLSVKRTDLGGLFRDAARGKDGPAWELARWLPDFRARRPLGADLRDAAADATSVVVRTGGKELALLRGDGGWAFKAPANWGPADELGDSQAAPSGLPFTGVRPLLTALTAPALGVDDYLDKPGDLAQYGLADADPARVRVELAGSVNGKPAPADVVYLGKAVEQNGKPAVPAKVYGKFEGDPAVFTLPFDRLEALRATAADPSPLRNRDLLPATAKDATEAIDVTVGGQTAKLRKLPVNGGVGRWWLFGGPAGPVEAKAGEVELLLATATKDRVARAVVDPPDPAAFAPEQVRAVLKFWAKADPGTSEPGKPPAEPTPKGEPVELTVGRTAEGTAAVRRTTAGGSVGLLLPADLSGPLARPRVAYLDPKVPPLDASKANRLTLAAGGTVTEVVRDDKGNWAFSQPEGKKGQAADTPRTLALVATLGSPPVAGVAAEAPSPEELKALGLDPPGFVATAGLTDGPDKERALQLGGPAGDGLVAARVAGRPLVLQVRAAAADQLRTTELRQHTVFTLDPATVTRLTVRGFKADKGPEQYTFEKGADGWKAVAPTPAGFAPDAAKLDAVVQALATVRAEAFVWLGNKPEFGLDPSSNAEALEIGVERKDLPPLTLVLGAKAGDGLVYAASASVPGEVFTTKLRAALDPLLGRPANFQAAPAAPPPVVTPPPARK